VRLRRARFGRALTRRGPARRLRAWLARAGFALLAATTGPVLLCARAVDPPTTAYILQCRIGALAGGGWLPVERDWVDLEQISPHAALAVVAAEDQKFPHHRGFDLQAIGDALDEAEAGGRPRGASTISQQVAKNLFLWPGRSFVRKGLEAWFTLWIEALWQKRRILEVYLNVAEFGRGVFGVEAASRRFFAKPAAELGPDEAALLAAVLPSPRRLRADAPSPYVRGRAARIRAEMERLGPGYLRGRT
jgi:monofunctional biosynthetic peptidoglycan transglycosylase